MNMRLTETLFSLSASVAGALRCHAVEIMTENEDITWNFGRGFIWSSIEPSLGIVSACLPTLRPLIRHFFPNGFGITSKKSSDVYRLQNQANFTPGTGEGSLANNIRCGSQDSQAHLEPGDDSNPSIMIRHEISWSSKQDLH